MTDYTTPQTPYPETSKPKRSGCLGEGVGCLLDIALFGCACLLLSEQTMISALVYLFALLIPVLVFRWWLVKTGRMHGLVEKLYGLCIVGGVLVLACIKPVEIEDSKGNSVVATPETIGKAVAEKVTAETSKDKSSKPGAGDEMDESRIPPGVSYTPAPTNEVVTLESALAELNDLIGLKSVKAEVEKFAKFVQVANQRRESGLKVAPISYHMVFTGNPGTGKTTVARIMAKIYRALGVVKKGHLVETDRGGLIAEYVGQTAVKTAKVIDFALDGVLFIDEAYAITEGDSKQGYGSECIATLLKRMEDDRDRLVVIVAGYTDEMKHFIDANPGLQSRFNRYIDFPDYSAEELAAMFRMRVKKNDYILSADAEHWLTPWIYKRTKNRDRKFGNGRWVRNEFEKAVERQAMRVAELENPTKEALMMLTLKDLDIKLVDPDASNED
ncbi:MAG: AAA family ATPase [Kiritimatiellae bacterium]|nr:AAA family ATPase [Kiritimatiellia bacterium]